MYKKILTLLIVLLPVLAFAQDSISIGKWTKNYVGFRIGAGVMPRFYIEPGIAVHKFLFDPPAKSCSMTMYASIEATTTYYEDRGFLLLGPKIGYEVCIGFLGLGIEAKYLSDGKNKDYLLVPKLGCSIMGIANLMYGYQFSFNDRPFPNIGAHQFSLVFVLYRMPPVSRR